MDKYDYDLICIGSGSAGGSAAFVAKKAGLKVAVIEEFKDKLGGHCPNYACVPTKALIKAGQVYKLAQRASEFGVVTSEVKLDFKRIAEYKKEIVNQLTGPRIEKNLHNAGIDLLWGRAKFVSPHELDIAGKKYSATNFVIATGSKEWVPPIPGLAETGYWVSDDAVKAETYPESVIMIGAGPIGAEFAQIFTSFGVRVTMIQNVGQVLQREDTEIAAVVQQDMEEQGIKVILNANIEGVRKEGVNKIVKVKVGDTEQEFSASEIMVATGRRANLDLNLEAAGVHLTKDGKLELNEYLQTNVAHIWAAGDAAATWQFTHTAAYEGDLAGRNICQKLDEKVSYDVVPRVTFVEPEVASVGMTEEQARVKNLDIKIGRFKIGSLGRALIDHDRRGMVKIIADAKSLQILGAHIAGSGAGQLIHELALAMKAKIAVTEIARMVHAYPTFSEAVAAAA